MPSETWYIISREVQNSYPQYPPNDAQITPKNTPEDFLFRAPQKDFQSLGTMLTIRAGQYSESQPFTCHVIESNETAMKL